MTRSVAPWCGKTDDTPAPDRVRVRVFGRVGGRCHRCSRKIAAGERWTLEHVKALVNGGANAEPNLDVTCGWCLPGKNAEDVAEKSATYQKRKRHLGIKPARPQSKWKRKIDGTVVLR